MPISIHNTAQLPPRPANKAVPIIIDRESNGVICSPPVAHAKAIAMGVLNGELLLAKLVGTYANHNFNDRNVHYMYVRSTGRYVMLPPDLVTNEWHSMRQAVANRIDALDELEYFARVNTVQTQEFYGTPVFSGLMAAEIGKCDPVNGNYSAVIQEWAALQNVPPSTAYKELKINIEYITSAYARNHAIYSKYVRLINRLSNKIELTDLISKAIDEFNRNSSI